MRRSTVLGAMLAIGALSLTVSAYQQAQRPKGRRGRQAEGQPVRAQGRRRQHRRLRRQRRRHRRRHEVPGWGQPILDKIKELTAKPVTRSSTRTRHGDHVSGNVEFPATVDIIAQENTKTNMEEWRCRLRPDATAAAERLQGQRRARACRSRTFKDKMTIGNGADRIDLYYFGRGHTNGDAWVVFPALRVMHAGDMFSGQEHPDHRQATTAAAASSSPTRSRRPTTRSRTSTRSSPATADDDDPGRSQEYGDFIRDFVGAVRDAKKAGKSADDFAASYKVPEKFRRLSGRAGRQRQERRFRHYGRSKIIRSPLTIYEVVRNHYLLRRS